MSFSQKKSNYQNPELAIQIEEDFNSVSDVFKDDTPIIKIQEV
jgi:hypothetical protein